MYRPPLPQRLYPPSTAPVIRKHRPLPDWSKIREELARRDHHVTLALLWTEYKAEHPDGYQYSQFVELYRRFEKKLSVVLRQHHRAGEKVFVDLCDGITMIDPDSGELVKTQLFVAALGASSYTFAVATLSQALPVWLDCHVRAKVEAACLVAQRWILAVLRHRTFYHLNELNAAIGELLDRLNDRVMGRHALCGSGGTSARGRTRFAQALVTAARANLRPLRRESAAA